MFLHLATYYVQRETITNIYISITCICFFFQVCWWPTTRTQTLMLFKIVQSYFKFYVSCIFSCSVFKWIMNHQVFWKSEKHPLRPFHCDDLAKIAGNWMIKTQLCIQISNYNRMKHGSNVIHSITHRTECHGGIPGLVQQRVVFFCKKL